MISAHAFGLIGQAMAALPPIAVLMVLARLDSLEAAGFFTIAAGTSAAVFSTALWGLRALVLVDRFASFSATMLLRARIGAMLSASLVVLLVTLPLGLNPGLIAGLVLFKASDGMIDLNLAFNQVGTDSDVALKVFAASHSIKLALLVAAVMPAMLFGIAGLYAGFVLSGVLVVSMALGRTLRSARGDSGAAGRQTIWQVIRAAAWFAIAAALCAAITSAPRISLAWFFSGDAMGVAAVSLSVATLFGMVFYSVWMRHQPMFRHAGSYSRDALFFLLEVALFSLLCAAFGWFVLPWLVAILFDINLHDWHGTVRAILVAAVFFFAGMSTCNLYKVTRRPWMESVGYSLALVLVIIAVVSPARTFSVESVLVGSGLLMLTVGVFAVFTPFRANVEYQG